jgi:hypothetical protein
MLEIAIPRRRGPKSVNHVPVLTLNAANPAGPGRAQATRRQPPISRRLSPGTADATKSSGGGSNIVGIVLGALGLAAGLAALGLNLATRRR